MNSLSPPRTIPTVLRLALVLVALATAAVLSACGGDDEAEAAQQVEEVAIAYGESDGEAACEFLSASALDQLGGESGCTREFETVPPAEFEIIDVQVDEGAATATVENVEESNEFELEFVEDGEEWKISSFPGLGTLAPSGETPAPTGPGDELLPEGTPTLPPTDTAPEDTPPE